MNRHRSLPPASGEPAGPVARGSRWLWPVVLAITITIASSRSEVAGPEINHFDKVVHFLVYGLLATLLARTPVGVRRAWIAVLVTSVFGLSDEFHQAFTPGRSVALADWYADTLGAALAVLLYVRWHGYRGLLERPLFRRKPRIETGTVVVPEKAA